MKDVDCQVFEDQLDALLNRTLPEEGGRQLQLHASSCPDCAMLLRVQEHLKLPPLEELEAEVPEDLLASVWSGVESGIEERGGMAPARDSEKLPADISPDVSAETPGTRRFGWFVPTLAAASVALLLSTGFLFSELRRSEGRERQLVQQVGDLDRWIAGQDGGSELVRRTAELAGGRTNRARALDFALSGQENITVETLLALLEKYPKTMVLFDASQIEGLSESTSRPSPELRGILTVLNDAFATLGSPEGVRVGEFVDWLASSQLPLDMALPKSPLVDLLS